MAKKKANGKWLARERASEMRAIHLHAPDCNWPLGQPCIKFSTDGTLPGAEIAHTMGTMDEDAIKAGRAPNDDGQEPFSSDVDEEQADWDADEEPHRYGPHPHHDEPMRPYPASKLDWPDLPIKGYYGQESYFD